MKKFPLVLLSLVVGILLLVYFTAGLVSYTVIEESMFPSLKAGDRVVVERFFSRINKLKNNQILTFFNNEKKVIKRIFLVENQKIAVSIENNVCIGEISLSLDPNIKWPIKNGVLAIPKGQYFVLGDNLWLSQDSRHYGLISKKNIDGRVIGVIQNHS